MVRGLGRAVTEFHKLGKTVEEVERDIAGSEREEGWTERVRNQVKRQLQRKVKERISQNNKQAAVARIRHNVERWKLEQTGGVEMLPGRVAGRIFQRLHELKTWSQRGWWRRFTAHFGTDGVRRGDFPEWVGSFCVAVEKLKTRLSTTSTAGRFTRWPSGR